MTVWDILTCWLSKDALKRRFLESVLTKFLTFCNFGKTLAMTIFICLKMFKVWCRFNKWNKKSRKSFSFLTQLHLNRERQIVTIQNRILVIRSECVDKHPYDSKLQQGRYFPSHLHSERWQNIIKVHSCWFEKYLTPFNIMTVKGCSETAVFREWSNQVFDSL